MPGPMSEPLPSRDLQAMSFDELFERYYRSVVYFFRNRGFSQDESLDLAQETFLKAFRGWEGFRHDSRRQTWLFKIATHVAINALRYDQAEKRSGDEQSLEESLEQGLPVFSSDPAMRRQESAPLEQVLEKERTRELRQALADLPPRMQRCVRLRLEQGLKYKEIARLTGVTVDTVKAHLFQARRQLKANLGRYLAEVEPGRLSPADESGSDG